MDKEYNETNIVRQKADVTWKIKKYKKIISRETILRSNFFNIEGENWYLWLYKTTDLDKPSNNTVTFQLDENNMTNKAFLYPVKIKLSIGRRFGKQQVFTEIIQNFSPFERSIKEACVLKLLTRDGSLFVNLEMKSLPFSLNKKPLIPAAEVKNFKSFHNNWTFSDVVFQVDETEIPAHKVVLASASSVFQQIFSRPTITNVVKIKNTDPNVFQEFLRFIYTGRVEHPENMASSLYDLSHKYDIPDLQAICQEQLENTLLVDNVISVLYLADRYDCFELKDKCIDYINLHYETVRETEAFKSLLDTLQVKKPRW